MRLHDAVCGCMRLYDAVCCCMRLQAVVCCCMPGGSRGERAAPRAARRHPPAWTCRQYNHRTIARPAAERREAELTISTLIRMISTLIRIIRTLIRMISTLIRMIRTSVRVQCRSGVERRPNGRRRKTHEIRNIADDMKTLDALRRTTVRRADRPTMQPTTHGAQSASLLRLGAVRTPPSALATASTWYQQLRRRAHFAAVRATNCVSDPRACVDAAVRALCLCRR